MFTKTDLVQKIKQESHAHLCWNAYVLLADNTAQNTNDATTRNIKLNEYTYIYLAVR